jgi:hypothetical protein
MVVRTESVHRGRLFRPGGSRADAELRRHFGDPVFISESRDGESSRMSGIDEEHRARPYSAENMIEGKRPPRREGEVLAACMGTEASWPRARGVSDVGINDRS